MKILAIETSCDDTGIAILEASSSKFQVLSNIVSSQQIHVNYGGVFPMMAKREHQNNLVPVLTQALKQAKLGNPKYEIRNPKQIPNSKIKILKKILEKENALFESVKEFLEKYEKPDVDFIAVTNGPGLEPCLWVGVNFAKALSYIWNIPVIPVNHIEAHIAVNFPEKINGNLKSEIRNPKLRFPAIALVVSGGHTQLILVKGIGNYEIIGETRDDAAGECFDKCARIFGLGYPGGPAIAKIASQWKSEAQNPKSKIVMPRPMLNTKDYDFSFSGLKTAVLYKVRDTKPKVAKSKEFIGQMCFSVQDAICDVLIKKTINSAKAYKAKTIILGGGVSANQELRKQFTEKTKKEAYSDLRNCANQSMAVIFPEKSLSTDNGLMIAVAGYFNRAKKIAWQKLSVDANLRVERKRKNT